MTVGRILGNDIDKGSGFALATSLSRTTRVVLTAKHVVGDQGHSSLQFLTEDKRKIPVESVEWDNDLDVAVLHLSEDVAEGLVVGCAVEGGSWQVETQPRPNDPKLYGTITDTHRRFVSQDGEHEIYVLQLYEKQNLGDYKGYSGSPVVLKSPTDAVIGVLIEQLRPRFSVPPGQLKPATNVLYAIPINDVLVRFGLTSAPVGDEDTDFTVRISRYLHQLSDQLHAETVFTPYIDLRCEDSTGKTLGLVNDFIFEWIESSDNASFLAVLGDYGVGKTTYVSKLFLTLAEQYFLNPRSPNLRIPLLIFLREYANIQGIEQILEDYCLRFNLILEEMFSMSQSGKLLIILDGFDEMSTGIHTNSMSQNFLQIQKLLRPKGKILLTSRTHFFRDLQEELRVLSLRVGPQKLIVEENTFRPLVVYISQFDNDDIINYIKEKFGKDWLQFWNVIHGTYNLSDLARRPILLAVISDSIPQIEKFAGKIDQTRLYGLYIDAWLAREQWRSLSSIDIVPFIGKLALNMFKSDRYSISFHELLELVKSHFEIMSYAELEAVESFMRTCTFLRRDRSGAYSFMHFSFLEYFVARELIDNIRSGCFPDVIRNKLISPEIAGFMSGILEKAEESILWDLIDGTRGKDQETVGYQGTNAVEVLKKRVDSFVNHDFSKTVLPSVNLEMIPIDGSSFRMALLPDANLMTNLINCDISHAMLRGASLGGNSAGVFDLSVSPDGSHVACAIVNGEVWIFCLTSTGNLEPVAEIQAHNAQLRGVAYHPHEPLLASCSKDRLIKLWDLHDNRRLKTLHGHTGSVGDICFTPDGNRLISVGSEGLCQVWNVTSGEIISTFGLHVGAVKAVACSPDGQLAASGGVDRTIRIWQVNSGKQVLLLEGHTSYIRGLAWAPTGKFIASAGSDGKICIWDFNLDKKPLEIHGHSSVVREVSFASGGRYVVSASWDGTAKVWEMKTGDSVLSLETHKGGAFCVSYVQSDSYLLTGSGDGTITSWDAATGIALSHYKLAGQYLDCTGLNITGVQGLDEDYILLIKAYGAVENKEL